MKTLAFVILILALILLTPLVVMWLWNIALVPAVAGISEIGYWQAFGISILCSILTKTGQFNKK